MKIVVDRNLCEANAVCVRIAPEVFQVDEADRLTLLMEDPPEGLHARIREAVRRCPKQALSVRP